MLILKRREGGSIVINGDIVVTILKIEGGSIKIGIDAPQQVEILRDELIGSRPSGADLGSKL